MNTFWQKFGDNVDTLEELELPTNSDNNINILQQILDGSNHRSLIEGISNIYDEICDVIDNEDDDDTMVNELTNEEDENEDNNENDDDNIEQVEIDAQEEDDDGTGESWLTGMKKKKKELTFEEQLVEYFLRLSDESNVKPNLQTYFSIIFIQMGIYWQLRKDMFKSSKKSTSQDETQLIEKFEKYSKMELIDLSICDQFGQTMFHLAASLDSTKIFDILLELDRNVIKYKNKLGKSAREEAMKSGQWGIVQNIALSQMGSRKKDKAKTEENRIESKRGIVTNFIKERQAMLKTASAAKTAPAGKEKEDKKDGDGAADDEQGIPAQDQLLEELLQTMLKLITKKLPLSDDMLLLVWKYEMSMNPNGDMNRLWLALSKTIETVLDNATNRRDWFWFKTYILQSIV